MYEVANLYDAQRIEDVNRDVNECKGFESEIFKKNISFKPKLKDLDAICGFEKLDENFDLYIDHN